MSAKKILMVPEVVALIFFLSTLELSATTSVLPFTGNQTTSAWSTIQLDSNASALPNDSTVDYSSLWTLMLGIVVFTIVCLSFGAVYFLCIRQREHIVYSARPGINDVPTPFKETKSVKHKLLKDSHFRKPPPTPPPIEVKPEPERANKPPPLTSLYQANTALDSSTYNDISEYSSNAEDVTKARNRASVARPPALDISMAKQTSNIEESGLESNAPSKLSKLSTVVSSSPNAARDEQINQMCKL